MKVLQINVVCGILSTGRIATDIHDILIQQGHESYIAYGRYLPKYCNNPIKIGSKFDNYVHAALTRVFDKHGFGSKKATEEFIRQVDKINPDVIHLHNFHGYYINIEILFNYLKAANKTVVWTLHDCWPFTGHCGQFDLIGCDKWKTGCYGCPQKKSYPSSILKDNSMDNFNRKKELFTGIKNMTIVTPSNWLAGLVKESFLGEYPVKVLNNGINLDVFKPTESDFRKKHNIVEKFIILGVAGTWSEKKGFNCFIELSNKLDDNERIVLVGVTKQQQKHLPYNTIGITRTNNAQELAEIYTSADVYANLSLEENFPMTNLEALACGTPVITFNTGGSIESIDNKCGLITEKRNINALSNSIEEIKRKGKSNYSSYCTKKANLLYDKKDMFNEYIDIYKKSGINQI